MRLPPTLLAGVLVLASIPASAQDVEMLGRRYGTRPPQAYFDQLTRDPLAFQFARGRTARLRAEAPAVRSGAAMVAAPMERAVEGVVRVPAVLGLFADSPTTAPFTPDTVAQTYFGEGPGTIHAYYDEVSGGRVSLLGEVHGWLRSTVTQAVATGGVSGLSSNTAGLFIVDLLGRLDTVDWGAYDNDGPDGVPNSGDDDGYVDILGVIQPTHGAECGGADQDDRIWSHKWSLSSAVGSPFATGTPAAGGGFITIDDYTIQPVLSCNQSDLNEIGVFAHELGHGFGLPDLYDTYSDDGVHGGAGHWSLMGSGSWGCDGGSADMPCHMNAWSKAQLGWVTVTTLDGGLDHGTLLLPPVETTGEVYRIDAGDGSGDYFLLENRQRLGFDGYLYQEGLLVWQIDPEVIAERWFWNRVNGYPHMGVWLRQADGLDELAQPGGGRGDRDDPFPYVSSEWTNDVFHTASNPSSDSHAGTATGLTILDIERVDDDVSFHLLTRFSSITVGSTGDAGTGGLVTVNGELITEPSVEFLAAPFEEHVLEAAEGDPIADGVRRGFDGWLDDDAAERVRTVTVGLGDTSFVARYGSTQMQLAIESTGGAFGVEPGSFDTSPPSEDLWFTEGTNVLVEALPQTGFGFVAWTGDLEGEPNPATADLSAPVYAGAEFELTFSVSDASVTIEAGVETAIPLVVANATAPIRWSVVDGELPPGTTLNSTGQVLGAASRLGTYPVRFQAEDALGLKGEGTTTFEVTWPEVTIAQLASDFLMVGPTLTASMRGFLDSQGNGDGQYDLGDFRAWILAHPELPLSAEIVELLGVSDPGAPVGRAREGGR